MKFKLQSKFKPAGDQPQAITKLVLAINNKLCYQTLLGVTGSGKTFTMAKVIEQIQKPTLVICHNKTLAAQLASEFQDFFPSNAVHYFVSYYDYYQPEAYLPRTDTYIEKETQINEEIDRLRNAATSSLMSRSDVLIVASVSCIYGLGNPVDYLELSLKLKVGVEYKRNKLIRRLTDMQYGRNDLELRRGSWRAQGDTLEIISSAEETITTLHFFDNILEKIEQRHIISGEVLDFLKSIIIFPAKHFVSSEDKISRAITNIRKELANRLKTLRSEGKLLEAARIEQRTNFDLEMLINAGFVAGIENYSRHIDGRGAGEPPSTLIDYFPDDFLLFIDESHQTIPQIGAMHAGDRSRKQTLVEYGFRLPSALDNRPLQFSEFEQKVNQTIFVSATPGPYELRKSLLENSFTTPTLKKLPSAKQLKQIAVIEQLNRPTGLLDPTIEIKPIKHQVDHLIEQIKLRTAKHERILVTTLSKKMAEGLTTYLADAGIKVQYLHSDVETFDRLETLRDLRLGIYDVIVGINLLREGLDLPEVSLVAILDADKEGFLRSETAFMQIMGRAARHLNGHVIMYADKITNSMQKAIDETTRRRKIQKDFNKKNKISPSSIVKKVGDSRLAGIHKETTKAENQHQIKIVNLNKPELKYLLEELTEQMDLAALNLEFELATKLRDQILEIKKILKLKK